MGLFGTDGVRGVANGDLTPELALAVASAAARVLVAHDASHRPIAVIGRDPRASGEMLEAAVSAGLAAAGADVLRVGVLPTPAVAYLTGAYGADLGVVLSASHNPMPDNGIKLFARGGNKLPDDIEAEIEQSVAAGTGRRPTGAAIGRLHDADDATERYLNHLLQAVPSSLEKVHVVVDCAHGAASAVAPELYRRAGARVTAIAADPDGLNINDGVGSTHLDTLVSAVRASGADLGIAHDGDADRCLAVDADGAVVDGDQILALCAVAMREHGELKQDTVVATVMSNLGFHHAMRDAGINVVTTAVGDRYVLEALRARRTQPRRRAERAHRVHRRGHDRRRAADRAARDGADGRHRRLARRPRRHRPPAAADVDQREGRRPVGGRVVHGGGRCRRRGRT